MATPAAAKQYKTLGDDLWKNRTEKNAELFSLTYGALVVQLVKDYEDYAEVNRQLDKMGYNIGVRLIEDFLARTSLPRCSDFRETAEIISKVAFRSFLNISPSISYPPSSIQSGSQPLPSLPTSSSNPGQGLNGPTEFILTLDENPLAEFAELPADAMGKQARAQAPMDGAPTDDGASFARGPPASGWNESEIGGKDEGLWFSNVLCGVIRGCLEMINLQVEAAFVADRLRGDASTDIRVRLVRVMEEEQPINDE